MADEEPISEPIDRRHSDLYHRFGVPDFWSKAPTEGSRIGWWRTWGRHKGEACPVCGLTRHADGCSEVEYPVAAGLPAAQDSVNAAIRRLR